MAREFTRHCAGCPWQLIVVPLECQMNLTSASDVLRRKRLRRDIGVPQEHHEALDDFAEADAVSTTRRGSRCFLCAV